jgi:hypothetical protein
VQHAHAKESDYRADHEAITAHSCSSASFSRTHLALLTALYPVSGHVAALVAVLLHTTSFNMPRWHGAALWYYILSNHHAYAALLQCLEPSHSPHIKWHHAT